MSEMISQRSHNLQMRSRGEPIGLLISLLRGVRRAWQAHNDGKLLAELSDHQLRDIGIRREHISHVVRRGCDI